MIRPTISRCLNFELEDVLAAIDDTDLVAIEVRPRAISGLFERVFRRLRSATGFSVTRDPAVVNASIAGSYDLLYVHVENLAGLEIIRSVENWRKRCRIRVCRIEELWLDTLQYRKLLELLRPFDVVFVGCQMTATELGKIIGVPVVYSPPSTDTLRLCPYPNPPDRTIDVFWMGRRAPKTHAALYRHFLNHRGTFNYVYDTRLGNSTVIDPAEHRTFLASQIGRSRYFMVNHAKANAPEDTRGQEELGYRFFEGAAGGSVMIGKPPNCASYREHFDWEGAVIEMSYNSEDIISILEELDQRPAALDSIRRRNVTNSLRRHDVAYRWVEVLASVGLKPRPQLFDRLGRLERLADTIAKGDRNASVSTPGSGWQGHSTTSL
jgi:hypothetical protein